MILKIVCWIQNTKNRKNRTKYPSSSSIFPKIETQKKNWTFSYSPTHLMHSTPVFKGGKTVQVQKQRQFITSILEPMLLLFQGLKANPRFHIWGPKFNGHPVLPHIYEMVY